MDKNVHKRRNPQEAEVQAFGLKPRGGGCPLVTADSFTWSQKTKCLTNSDRTICHKRWDGLRPPLKWLNSRRRSSVFPFYTRINVSHSLHFLYTENILLYYNKRMFEWEADNVWSPSGSWELCGMPMGRMSSSSESRQWDRAGTLWHGNKTWLLLKDSGFVPTSHMTRVTSSCHVHLKMGGGREAY